MDERANASFEDNVEDIATEFDEDATVEYDYTIGFFSASPERVTVQTSEEVSADEVARRVEEETGESVKVVVVRQEVDRATP